jgi:signal transduction histidine kinase
MASNPDQPTSRAAAPSERWWGLLWDGFLALTLVVPTLYAVADAPDVRHGAVTIGLVGAFGLWHWQAALRRPEWEGRPVMLVWFVGVLVLTWLLLGRHGSYLILLYGLFPQVFGLLDRLRYTVPAVIALIVLVFWRTGVLATESTGAWLINIGGSVLVAMLIGMFVNALVRQNTARQQALDALQATREELAATSRRAGVLAERERLAREIHDTVAQGFAGIVMQLEASEQALDTAPDQARQHLDRAKRSARDSLAEVRRAVHALRPEVLEGTTLADAVDRTVRRWSTQTAIPVDTSTEGVPSPLPPTSEIALLRTGQEALANVAKHAHATRVAVRLAYAADEISLTVDDDGVGFDPDGEMTDGQGLRGIAERLVALDGQLHLDSQPGRGTTLTAAIPSSAPPQEADR